MSDFRVEPTGIEIAVDAASVPFRIGLIALATDYTVDRDFARICDPNSEGVYVTRIDYHNPTTPENLRRTGPLLTEAAAQILPGEPLDVIAYGCTSASVVLGEQAVVDFITSGRPGVKCTTPASAALAAFEAVGVKRISVLTPYNQDVTTEVATYFKAHGLEIAGATYLNFLDDREMAKIAHSSIIEAGSAAMADDADALFLSCTALRSVECVAALEERLGKPVITSNQALAWRAMRLAGSDRKVAGFGRLLSQA